MPAFRPNRAPSLLGGALLLSSACGQEAAKTPNWPEQPSPAYPQKGATEATASPDTRASAVSRAPASGPPEASSLAKQYSGRSAQSVLAGKATYYADSLAGHRTANGDVYEPSAFTAAHKKLPFGTIVRVIRVDNGAVTYAKINDRGPFGPANRIIDLSRAAAVELDMRRAGVVDVRVEVVGKPND